MVEDTINYDDGNWYAMTLGHFIGLLVDAGHDPAVLFRVTKDYPSDINGAFTRELEVVMLPNGYVKFGMEFWRCDRIHKTLAALLEAGIVE